jgi:hypothetical protein
MRKYRTLIRCSLLASASLLGVVGVEAPARAQVTPLYGNVDPFWGNLDPFYGNISPFYGNIDPFWGNIDPFYGNIDPFYGNIDPFWGNLNPFYGNIDPFYSNVGTYWRDFGSFWDKNATLLTSLTGSAQLTSALDEMIVRTEKTWGSKLLSATSRSFRDGVGKELFARHKIDPANGASLQALSANERGRFFLDWYDTLMAYSGRDRIDHWMATVRWTPTITQEQGSGTSSLIGIVDGRLRLGDADVANNVVYQGGYLSSVEGHGVSVASLIVGAHDNNGVMGIAPNARVVTYNPFDSTNTASWSAVAYGVETLANTGASVLNLSLGVSGHALHPDWRKVFFDPAIAAAAKSSVFVVAAGNDGKTQLSNLGWDFARDPALIVVGSVDPTGKISSFSNTPGVACLTSGLLNLCQESLMNRFITAPGELLLTADGQGGVVRRSGTSFAAPLVSGAITLLHDRWPWLRNHPKETVNIILQSARDAGLPGTDPVYGRGILDVKASQSPLNFNNLKFYEVKNGVQTQRSAAEVRMAGAQTTWEADKVFFYLHEPIGATFRDFAVPMSTLLSGKVGTLTGRSEYFQRFIEGRMRDWISGKVGSFTDVASYSVPTMSGLQLAFSASSPETFVRSGGYAEVPHSSVSVRAPASGLAFTAGVGEGAIALMGENGFDLTSDYRRDGGINPLLGLASGGAFASLTMPVADATTLSFGVTRQSLSHARSARTDEERAALQGLDAQEAAAVNVKLTHRLGDALSISGTYARVREGNSLLGVQSRLDDVRGATSDTATFTASYRLGAGLTLASAATAARTRTDATEQGFATEGDGVLSTAFALAVTKQGLVSNADMVRFSIAQPLHIERGELSYTGVEVVDRSTGELGSVTRAFGISGGARNYTSELLYAAPLFRGAGEFGLFGRMSLRPEGGGGVDRFAVGTRLRFGF